MKSFALTGGQTGPHLTLVTPILRTLTDQAGNRCSKATSAANVPVEGTTLRGLAMEFSSSGAPVKTVACPTGSTRPAPFRVMMTDSGTPELLATFKRTSLLPDSVSREAAQKQLGEVCANGNTRVPRLSENSIFCMW